MRWAFVIGLTGCSYAPPSATTDATDPGEDGVTASVLVPSNHEDLAPLDATGLPSLIMDNVAADGATVWRIYTDTGRIERESESDTFVEVRANGFGVDPTTRLQVEQSGPFTVLFVDRLAVQAQVSFEGHGDRALIVIARRAIEITGEVDFSGGFTDPGALAADFRRGGPGGGDGAINAEVGDTHGEGCGGVAGAGGRSAGVGATPGNDSGGGGGGGAREGARGGHRAVGIDEGGPGGPACMTATLIPLIGGSGGGAGDTSGGGGDGGGGGGAIQLTSLTQIVVTGVIDVGGKGGRAQALNDEGGGGGGAGGGILLEAPSVAVSGVLAANGGGGGSGRETNNGAQGTLTTLPAPGGVGSSGSGDDGRGGSGGALDLDAQQGDDHSPGGGGGGGAVGAIRINVVAGGLTLAGNAIVSPQHTAGAVVFSKR